MVTDYSFSKLLLKHPYFLCFLADTVKCGVMKSAILKIVIGYKPVGVLAILATVLPLASFAQSSLSQKVQIKLEEGFDPAYGNWLKSFIRSNNSILFKFGSPLVPPSALTIKLDQSDDELLDGAYSPAQKRIFLFIPVESEESYYADTVPFRPSSDLNKRAATMISHEYGHAVFFANLKGTWADDRRRTFKLNKIIADYEDCEDCSEKNAKIAEAKLESAFVPIHRWSALETGYSEFFSDLVAYLVTGNHELGRYSVSQSSSEPNYKTGNKAANLESAHLRRFDEEHPLWSEAPGHSTPESHVLFSPVKTFLWNHCLKGKNVINYPAPALLGMVLQVIGAELDSHYSAARHFEAKDDKLSPGFFSIEESNNYIDGTVSELNSKAVNLAFIRRLSDAIARTPGSGCRL